MMLQPYTRIKDDEKASAWWSETNYREGKGAEWVRNQVNWIISPHSVRSRHRNNFKLSPGVVTKRGPTSPLAPVEPLLVELCIQRARMGQPLSQSEGILLVNSIIQGTVYQEIPAVPDSSSKIVVQQPRLCWSAWSVQRRNYRLDDGVRLQAATGKKGIRTLIFADV
jgi:hypothetical protein